MAVISDTIDQIKECASRVYNELGSDWLEKVYQEALEVELRLTGIEYESQRILPVEYKGFVVGEGIPDFVVWVRTEDERVAIVVDLKQDNAIKESHEAQVRKYIEGLKRQLRPDERVHDGGLVICFPKASLRRLDEELVECIDELMFRVVSS